MVLEACMLCLDNSAYARDGDISPSRLVAQEETAGIVAGAKTSMHHENAVGVLTYGGDRVSVHLSPTSDMGAILSALHGLRCGGGTDFTRGIQVAQLALKHRMNKNQKQRIIVFVGSPLRCSERQLTVLGRQLKKNNVAVDVISFGEVQANSAKLKAFHEAVDSSGTSRLLEIEPQPGELLSDLVLQSRLLHDPEAPGGGSGLRVLPGAGAAGAAGMEFGVDPNADPELYMALQLSLQEDQQRTRQQGADAEANTGNSNSSSTTAPAAAPPPALLGDADSTPYIRLCVPCGHDDGDDDDDGDAASAVVLGGAAATDVPTAEQIEMMEGIDDELRQALLLSLQDFSGRQPEDEEVAACNNSGSSSVGDASSDGAAAGEAAGAADATATAGDVAAAGEAPDVSMTTADVEEGVAEDGTTRAAADGRAPAAAAAEPETSRVREGDPLASVLDSLPGVDVSDPRMQEALRAAATTEEEKEGEEYQNAPTDNTHPKPGGASDGKSKEQN